MEKILFWLHITLGIGGVVLFIATIECLNWIPAVFLISGILGFLTAAHIQPSEYIYEIHIHEKGVEDYGDV